MSMWEHCKKAREDKKTLDEHFVELEKNGASPDINDVVMWLYNNEKCKEKMHSADDEDWNEYNREVKGAVYPEDVQPMTHELAKKWVAEIGEKWDKGTTTTVGMQYGVDFSKYSDWCFWVTMNMGHSDFSEVFGEDVSLYVKWANAFLVDADSYSPSTKLARYYKFIVKH